LLASIEETVDFFICEDSITPCTFFQFRKGFAWVFRNPTQLFDSITQGGGEDCRIAIDRSGTSFSIIWQRQIDEDFTFLSDEFGSDMDKSIGS